MAPSRLSESATCLILDASSVLNLLGSGQAFEILHATGKQAVIVEEAAQEVILDPFTKEPGSDSLELLYNRGVLRKVQLSSSSYDTFVGLLAAPSPDGLDDGEAATAAHAVDGGGVPVFDEKKATRVASQMEVPAPICTLDLLAYPAVLSALGRAKTTEAVYSALIHARMRIPAQFRPWVFDLIGPARLQACPSVSKHWLDQLGNSFASVAGRAKK